MAEVNPVSPQDVELSTTQRKRLAFITSLETQMASLISDPAAGRMYLAALKDVDSQALGIKRIKSDEDIAMADGALARELNNTLIEIERITGNPFKRVLGNDKVAAQAGADDSKLPSIDIIEGQMDIGIENLTYAEFESRVQPQLEAERLKDA